MGAKPSCRVKTLVFREGRNPNKILTFCFFGHDIDAIVTQNKLVQNSPLIFGKTSKFRAKFLTFLQPHHYAQKPDHPPGYGECERTE